MDLIKKLQPAASRQGPASRAQLFVRGLLAWNSRSNSREMPWKGEKDPYRIWLSEIILQQTRVEQGLKYYEKFTRLYPDVHALARAPEEQVFKAWEGLGYYSRCRNLIATARRISGEMDGSFPPDYKGLLSLKGVGAYTAAAIASFAYNHDHAVLDGNVFRVLSRVFGIETPIDSAEGRNRFAKLAQELLPSRRAAVYNQAIMDFGATVCKPQPDCGNCFFSASCDAFAHNRQQVLPVKEKTIRSRERWFNYFILEFNDEVAIRRRQAGDIWQGLHEFVLIETDRSHPVPSLTQAFESQYGIAGYAVIADQQASQKLTHQAIRFHFLFLRLSRKYPLEGFQWIKRSALSSYAFPRSLQRLAAGRPC